MRPSTLLNLPDFNQNDRSSKEAILLWYQGKGGLNEFIKQKQSWGHYDFGAVIQYNTSNDETGKSKNKNGSATLLGIFFQDMASENAGVAAQAKSAYEALRDHVDFSSKDNCHIAFEEGEQVSLSLLEYAFLWEVHDQKLLELIIQYGVGLTYPPRLTP